ncbi:hypothetical protein ACR6C2_00045 [Streptomyces sp. INA 01156]
MAERSRRALAEVRYAEHGTVRPEAVALREAFDFAATGRPAAAAEQVQKAVNDIGDSDKALRGWLREQKAAYLHLTDPVAAQQALAGALTDNTFVLRSVHGAAPVRLKAAAVQSRAAAEFLAERYRDGVSLRLGVQALFEEVVWAMTSAPTTPRRPGRAWASISGSPAAARRSCTARDRTTCGRSRPSSRPSLS